MNAYAWSHEFDHAREANAACERPSFLQRFLRVLVSMLSGGNSGWDAGARGL